MAFDDDNEMIESGGQDNPINDNLGVRRVTGITTIDKIDTVGGMPTITPSSEYEEKKRTAKEQASLDIALGVEHVLDDLPKEDFVTSKQLYESKLGITEYDELRTKLNLADNESFTDYYARSGGYVPKGFEIQAKLLLAEEKRKKLYTQVELGNMSEEDFLYEAYGKDLLKQDGIDFESPLYWYQRMKNKNDPTRFEDPRDNAAFMEELIRNARALFEQEYWYKDATMADITEMQKYVTGEVLDAKTVATLFPEFFGSMSDQYDQIEKLIKYYRGGLLQGFNPTIDLENDGKIDYYYAPDGKLYNVNETGKGANTMRAVYNADGSLNRIVPQDTYLGEIGAEFLDGLATIFTDVVDLGALAIGAVVDIFDGGDFGSTVAEFHSSTQQFWNSIPVIGDQEYVVDSGWATSDGRANWANYGRQGANLIGSIVPTLVIAYFTAGASLGAQAAKEGIEEAAILTAKEIAEAGMKKVGKEITEEALEKSFREALKDLTGKEINEEVSKRLLKAATQETAKKKIGYKVAKEVTGDVVEKQLGKRTVRQTAKQYAKNVGKFITDTAVSLTRYQNGFGGTGWGARIGSATMVAVKDTLSTTAVLKVNQERLGLTDDEVVGRSLTLGAIDLASGILLRSVGDSSALGDLASLSQKTSKPVSEVFQNGTVKGFFAKIATGNLSGKSLAAYGITNAAMDLLDNVLTATAQTTLTQTASDEMGMSAWIQSMGQVLNSPQFTMNMVYQSYQNFKDVRHISAQKVMEANVDAFQMDTIVRTYLNTRKNMYIDNGDLEMATAISKVLEDYDNTIRKYVNTKNQELEDSIKSKPKKEGEEENTKIEIPNYSKGEAIVLAVSDLVENKLELQGDHELVTQLRNHFSSKVQRFAMERTKNIFKQINADNMAYRKLATNALGGLWARVMYGKAARDMQANFMKAMYEYYYKGPESLRFVSGEIQQDVAMQCIQDLTEQAQIYERVWDGVVDDIDPEKNPIKTIEVNTLSDVITLKTDSDGKPVTNKQGTPLYKVIDDKHQAFFKKNKAKFQEYMRRLHPGEEGSMNQVVWLKLDNSGSELDSKEHKQDSQKFMAAAYKLWEDLLGEDNPIFQIDETNYIIRPSGLGGTMDNLNKIGTFISGATYLKLALAGKADASKVKLALQTLLLSCSSVKNKKEFDSLIENNIKLIPSLFNHLVDGKSFKKADAAALLNYIEQYLIDYNNTHSEANGKKTKPLKLPEDFTKSSVYNDALKLKEFMKDYDELKDIVVGRKPNTELTESELKTINKFIRKYSTQINGVYTNSEVLTLAYDEGLIGEKNITSITSIRDFILGKVDTSLESVKLQEKERGKLSASNIDIDQMKSYIVNKFEVEEFPLEIKVPTSKRSGDRNVKVLFKDIGSDIGYKQYLSSLNKDPNNTEVYKNTIEDYAKSVIKALGYKSYNSKEVKSIEEDLRLALNPDNDLAMQSLARGRLALTLKSRYEKIDLVHNEMTHVKVITNTQKTLNNRTNMCVIDLNILSSSAGSKVARALERLNPDQIAALAKTPSIQGKLDILFSSKDEQIEFMRGIATIERLQETYGGYNLEIPIDSSLFHEIIHALGYHPREITSLTRGEKIIPGIYFNNDTEGVILASKKDSYALIRHLENALQLEAQEQAIKDIKFKNPVNIIEEASGLMTLVGDDVKLYPEEIILNSLNDPETFKAAITENFNIIETSIKQGKNAGNIFKYILSSVKGNGITGEGDSQLDATIKVYKSIYAFAELFDSKSKAKFGTQLLSKEAANALKKTYGDNTCFIFKDADDGFVEVSVNPTATKQQFLDIALKRLNNKKTYVRGLSSLLPLEVYRDEKGMACNKLKLSTRYEDTDIVSAYTTISWLAYKLANELDVYSFVTTYEKSGLNLRGVDLSEEAHSKALTYLRGKSKSEVLSLEQLNDNVFVQMQRQAYIASSTLREIFIDALNSIIDTTKANVDVVAEMFGNQNHRRDLARALQIVLLDPETRKGLKVESGFIEITDELAQRIINNLEHTNIKAPKDYANMRQVIRDSATETNTIGGSQFTSFNPETSEITLDINTMKEILRLIPLEYSVIVGHQLNSVNTKLLAMIKSASHIEDGSLAISTKDLYELTEKDIDYLISITPSKEGKKDLETIKEALKSSTLYRARHEAREQALKLANTDIKMPSEDSTVGDVVTRDLDFTDEQYATINKEINRLINNASISKARDQYIKFSTLRDPTFARSYELQQIAKILNIQVLPFVDHQGSLQLQNLIIEENLYYLYNNMADFANSLIESYHMNSEKAMETAFNYYIYSTGMQMQGAHPEFLMIDTSTGKVIDIAMSGRRGNKDSGLIARLYNNYFEADEVNGGLKFKETFTHTLNGKETITVNPRNLIAVRLNTNVLSTTFNPANFDIEIYDIGNHEKQFVNIFADRIKSVARNNNIDIADPDQKTKLEQEVNKDFYIEEYANTVGKNRQILNKAREILYDPENILDDPDTLSVSSADYTKQEVEYENHYNKNRRPGENSLAEQKENDALRYGVTKQGILKTEGMIEYIEASDRKLIRNLIKESDNIKLTNLSEEFDTQLAIVKGLELELKIISQSKITEEDIEELRISNHPAYQEIKDTYDRINTIKNELGLLHNSLKVARLRRRPLLDEMSALHSLVEGDNPKVVKGTPEYSVNATRMRETLKPPSDALLAEIITTQKKLSDYHKDLPEALDKLESLFKEHNIKENPAFKGTETYKQNALRLNGNEATGEKGLLKELEEARALLSDARKAKDEFLESTIKANHQIKDTLDLYEDNRPNDFIKAVDLLVTSDNPREEIARKMIVEYLRRNKSVEADLLKLFKYDFDKFKNRSFESTVQVNDKHIPISKLLKNPFVIIDSEVMYNLETNTHHLYEVSILYYDGVNPPVKATKYIPYTVDDGYGGKKVITSISDLREKFKDFFEDYYDKYDGSKLSIDNLVNNKSDNNFDALLSEANSKNATLIGFNSKEFDIPKLIDAKILEGDDTLPNNHSNLLKNSVDLFDIVKSPVHNLDLYGGKATLVAIAEQLDIEGLDKLKNSHFSDTDNALVLGVLNKIIEENKISYESELLQTLSDIYSKVTGDNNPDNALKFMKDTFKNLKLEENEYINTANMHKLETHVNNILTDETNTHFNKVAELVGLMNELDVMKKSNVLIRYLNNTINSTVDKNFIDFANVFSIPEIKNSLIDAVAFLTRDIDLENANDKASLAKHCNDRLLSLAFEISKIGSTESTTDRGLIDGLIRNKDSIFEALGIDTDSEEFKDWKSKSQYTSHNRVEQIISAAYGKDFRASLPIDNAKNTVAYGISHVTNFVNKFSFLSPDQKNFITDLCSNFYDYKGDYTDISKKGMKVNALSNHDNRTIDWLLTDPLLEARDVGIYRKATSTANKVTLMRTDEDGNKITQYPKNMTIYLSEKGYRELMGYGDNVPIDYNSINDYIGVIRYPLDKFDSMHYLKLEIISDGGNLDTVVTPDTMLALNGDLDGDNLKIIRTDNVQSVYGSEIKTAGKYNSYELLDEISELALNSSERDIRKDTEEAKAFYTITNDNDVAEEISRLLIEFNRDGIGNITVNGDDIKGDYYTIKEAFISKYSNKYSEKLLESIFIKEPADLSSLVYGSKGIVYVSYMPNDIVLNTNYNKVAKRLIMLANASKHGVIAFNDTQTGMLQKSFNKIDWSIFKDLDLMDNAISLSGTTSSILNEVPSKALYQLFIDGNNPKLKELATEFKDILLSDEGRTSDKIELILRINQLRTLKSDEYKNSVITAIDKLKASSKDSKFVAAMNRYTGDSTNELIFFNTIKELIDFKKALNPVKIKGSKNNSLMEVILNLCPEYDEVLKTADSDYNPGKEVPVFFSFNDDINVAEDQIQWTKWTSEDSKEHYGSDNLRHISASTTKTLSTKQLRIVGKYEELDEMSVADIKSLNIPYNSRCTYYFIEERNGKVIYVRSLGIDTAKVMLQGNANTKSTPARTIDLDKDISNENLRNALKQHNVCAMFKYKSAMDKPEKISSRYIKGEHILIDAEGKVTDSIDEAIGFIDPKARVHVLENTLLNKSEASPVNLEDSAYGNNMLSTGGIGATNGIFVNTDKDGNKVLEFDNTKYQVVKKAIQSINEYDRYSVDAKDLYEHLAVLCILDRYDDNDKMLKGKTKSEMLDYIFNNETAREFIYNYLTTVDPSELSGKLKKILSVDMFNKIYGIIPSGVDTSESTNNLNYGNGKGVGSNSPFYTSSQEIRGINKYYYDIEPTPNMSTLDFINAIRGTNDGYISAEAAKRAEQAGLLLNKRMPDSEVFQGDTENTSNKTTQLVSQHTSSDRSIATIDTTQENLESYRNKYKFKVKGSDKNKNTRAGVIPGTSISDDQKYLGGKRLSNLLLSICNTKGTYKDKDDILTDLNQDVHIINSMDYGQRYFTKEGGIKYDYRNSSGFKDSTISEYRDAVYDQRRSPLFWKGVSENKDSKKFENTYNTDMSKIRTSKDLTNEDMKDKVVQDNLKTLTEDTKRMYDYKQAVSRFVGELDKINSFKDSDKHNDIIFGNLVGSKEFVQSKFSLNFGGKLYDSADIEQNRSLRQIYVDQQNAKRQLDYEFNIIKNLCADNDCAEELQLYAYILTLDARLKSTTDESKFKEDRKFILEELNSLGIGDTSVFIKDFETAHKDIARRFVNFLTTLDSMSSKYSLDSNEPTNNIFRLLATKVYANKKNSDKFEMNNLKKAFKSGAPKYEQIGQGESDLKNYTASYNNYNLFTNLENTINEVSRRASILAHSERLKRDGVIDSSTIQTLLEKEFSDAHIINMFTDPDIAPRALDPEASQGLVMVINRLSEKFSNDEEFIDDLMVLKNFISNRGKVGNETKNYGELNLELLHLLSKKVSSYKMSLDKALDVANTTNSADADAVIYAYKQMQDIYATLMYINPNAGKEIAKSILNYAEKNNLTLVDQHGREFSQEFVYQMSEGSLEYLPKVLEQKLAEIAYPKKGEGYNTFLVMQMLGGNAFFMDKGLAEMLGKQVFIQKPRSAFNKAFTKSAGWCVKMIMASPFKLVDRFLKFTMFDAATLSSANHRTLLKQGEAYKDLRAFFSSKGGYSSDNLAEFIKTQGISFDGVNFDGLLTGDPEASTGGVFKTYTNKVGDVFTFQTLSQRYAYWLATKESIEKGDYSVAGSAYHLRKQLEDSNLTSGEKAAFMMGQMLGSTNDFPSISKTFNQYGFVFTTFPLASMRYGIGQLRSAAAAVQDLFTEGSRLQGAKWLARNSSGVIGTLLLEQFLVNMISSMYGVDEDDEEREEWEKVGALPNITQTIIQGQPIMDTFSSMNPNRELLGLFVETTNKDEDNETKVDGVTRFIRKNIISHMHPVVKSVGEVVLQKDLIDDQLIDTKDRYNGFENIFRKASAYFIGSAGANALVKTFQQDGLSDLPSTFKNGLGNAINAELGNTKATKENKKNYYKALSILNEYLYSDMDEGTSLINNNENFNYANYNEVKAKIYPLINREASPSELYNEITVLLQNGYTLQEIRAAIKNCSVSGKLSKISDRAEFIESISEADLQNIKTALAYENYILPWLDESVGYLTKEINKQQINPDYYQAPYYYRPNAYTNNYYSNSYSRPISSDNYTKRNADVYDVYQDMLENIRYKNQQAEYANNQKKWSGN